MAQWTRFLVTGARGFIGQRLVHSLVEQGVEVTCLDRPPARRDTLSELQVRRVTGDVRNDAVVTEAMDQADVVVHLAATTAPRSEDEAFATNVLGTRNLAEIAGRRSSPPVLIYVSSLAVAGPNSVAVTESLPCRPVSIYGRTKLAAEQALREMADRLPITVIRPPCVFGPGDRNLLSLFQSVRRGWNLVSHPQYRYSFLHVDDLVTALVTAARCGHRLRGTTDRECEGTYYVADAQPVTFPELGDMIAECLGRQRVRHVRVPRLLGWTAATVGECLQWVTRRRVFLNRDKAREAYGGSWVCDATRARAEIDFDAATPLVDRLRETASSYWDAGWLPRRSRPRM